MSKKLSALSDEAKERLAAQIVAASEGLISVPKAMKQVGFDTPTRKNNTISKRVYRTSKRMVVVDEKTVPSSASASASVSTPRACVTSVVAGSLENSSVSSLSNPPSGKATRRRNTPESFATPNSPTLPLPDVPSKKRRRTTKQKNQDDAGKMTKKRKENHAIKMVTKQIAHYKSLSPTHPCRSSLREK